MNNNERSAFPSQNLIKPKVPDAKLDEEPKPIIPTEFKTILDSVGDKYQWLYYGTSDGPRDFFADIVECMSQSI